MTIDKILQAAAAHYGCQVQDLVGRSKRYPIAEQRQVAMYLARELTTASFPAIGRAFDRDHSTVMYADQKVRDTWRDDLQRQVRAITALLENA